MTSLYQWMGSNCLLARLDPTKFGSSKRTKFDEAVEESLKI